VLLQRRHQEAVATARAVCHCFQLVLVRQRVRLLVELGVEFSSDDPRRRYHASLQAPPVAVLLTLIRACDPTTALEVDLGDGFAEHRRRPDLEAVAARITVASSAGHTLPGARKRTRE
jgi:hypothetical protein